MRLRTTPCRQFVRMVGTAKFMSTVCTPRAYESLTDRLRQGRMCPLQSWIAAGPFRMPATRAPKFQAPRASQVVSRGRVDRALTGTLKSTVCWLTAPAGYGKTTAMADYVRHRRLPVIWYRVDEGDRDVACLFLDLSRALPRAGRKSPLPVFGPEYADQLSAFALRYCRAWFARLGRRCIVVFDDMHRAEAAEFHEVIVALLRERPDHVQIACVSRNLPGAAFEALRLQGQLNIVDQSILEFSDREADG